MASGLKMNAIYTNFQLGEIFFVIDNYNKFVLEGYGFYNENAEPNLTAASCERWI